MALQVWLPLTGHLDNQGLSDITVTNNGATVDNSGKLGKCYYFNGSAQYLQFNKTLGDIYTKDFSYAAWINPSDSTRSIIISEYASSGSSNVAYELTANRGIRLYWNGAPDIYPTNCTLPLNTWSHTAIVKTTDKVDFYVNGELRYTYTGTLSDRVSTSCIRIGDDYRGGTSVSFMGYLNDVRIYDHALSAKEVHLLSQGLVAHYKLDNNGNGGDNIIPGTSPNEVQYTYPSTSYSDKFYKTSTVVPSASQYVLSFWAKSTNSGDKVRAHWYSPNTTTGAKTSQGVTSTASDGTIDFTLSDQWEKYWCIWTQSATTSAKKLIFPRMFSQASGQATGTGTVSVKCVKLEEGNQPTAWCPNSADPLYSSLSYNSTLIYDCSGYNNHSSASTHLPTLSESPRYSVSSSFANNAYSSFAGLATSGYANSYTFAWWGRFGNCNGHMMWGFANGNRLNLYCYSNNSYWNTGNGTSNPFNVPMSPYLDSKFHHFAVTGDGTTAKLYIDGEFKANATTYQGITGTTLILNGWDTGSSYKFNGALSDFRLYATALSAEDIQQLYNAPVSVSNTGAMFTQGEFIES